MNDPTPDERLGMAWWNNLTEAERAKWLKNAKSAIPAAAWTAFKSGKFGPEAGE